MTVRSFLFARTLGCSALALLAALATGCADDASDDDNDPDDTPPVTEPLSIVPGVGIGDLRVGMSYADLVAAYGEATNAVVFNGMATARYPDLGVELFLTSPEPLALADDAVLYALSSKSDDAPLEGDIEVGAARSVIEGVFGESPDVVAPAHYYPDGFAVEYGDDDEVAAFSIFAPYELAPTPPPMLPASSSSAPFQAAAPLSGGGFEVAGELIDVVDTHLHTGQWGQQPSGAKEFVGSVQPPNFRLYTPANVAATLDLFSPIGIRAQLAAAGGSIAIVYAVYAQRTVGYATNRQVEAMLLDPRNDGWAVGMASINTEGLEDAELRAQRVAALSSYFTNHPGRFVGIKLAHAHQGVALDDEVMLDVYDVAAEHGVPVLLHTGFSPFPNSKDESRYYDPSFLEGIVGRFDGREGRPRVEFVLAHVGQSDARAIESAFELAEAFDNVWLEVSALRSPLDESDETAEPQYGLVLREIKERGLISRSMWGSDGPQFAGFVNRFAGEVTDAMMSLGYTVEEMRTMMSGTARLLYFPEQR